MPESSLLFRYAPAIGALLIILNALLLLRRGTKLGSVHPERREGYRLIGRTLLVYCGIPAVAFALASIAGVMTLTEFHFRRSVLEPRPRLTSFDWLFVLASLAIMARFTFWLFFGDGAEFLVDHGDLFKDFPAKPFTVKVLWIVVAGVSLISMLRTVIAFL